MKTNTYPKTGKNPTIANSDPARPNIGVCFSGGGSRAMTCAWGQLLGLKELNLINRARYISSVSGGTWASSVYSYLPEGVTDKDLLGTYYPPARLSLETQADHLDITQLTPHSLGQAPAGISIDTLVAQGVIFLLFNKRQDHKWLWADLVASFILEPYKLRDEGENSWSSSKYFSLSHGYARDYFPQGAPKPDDFFFVRQGRPFVIMNNNLMEPVKITDSKEFNIVQLPNQVTPVAGGVQGQTPDKTITGGGSVESYGYGSTLIQKSSESSPVAVTISQPYSLIDIVSTSSAFFAETIAQWILEDLQDSDRRKSLIQRVEKKITPAHKKDLLAKAETDLSQDIEKILEKELEKLAAKGISFLGDIVPSYNYWPISPLSTNREIQFTDGGTLENTGILGILSQTDTGSADQEPLYLVVFDNPDVPLEIKTDKQSKTKHIIAATQAAPLFGIDFDTQDGTYKVFTPAQQDPTNTAFKAESLVKVFNNDGVAGDTPFDGLVKGLYAASCGALPGSQPDETLVNTSAPFYEMTITTVANPLANISPGRTIHILYIQNAKILNWQNQITDQTLASEINKGQNDEKDPLGPFKNFPYYSTFFKIGLAPKESNALSQMWAWTMLADESPLKKQLQSFFDNASA
ncbi:MAG: hypothetical protein JEZ12_14335 [Desulfobacterium sp.]|nr:hypothetical protein [Desulfobacterium sp.]